jgi:hypothetical protein
MEILEAFAREAPFDVLLARNEQTKGFVRTFEQALEQCSGGGLLLSDQDDVWFPEKLSVIEEVFAENPRVMVLIHDQVITDSGLAPTGNTLYANYLATGLTADWLTTGCCTAIRAELRSILMPFPPETSSHDVWIHRVGKALAVRKFIPVTLQYYRRHGSNTSNKLNGGCEKPNALKMYKRFGLNNATEGWLEEVRVARRLEQVFRANEALLTAWGLSANVHRALQVEERRIRAHLGRVKVVNTRHPRRLLAVLHFLAEGNYQYFMGWKSAAKDLLR